jgi:hypothetical protein
MHGHGWKRADGRLMATCVLEMGGIRARARVVCRDWPRCPQDDVATQGDDDMVAAFSAGHDSADTGGRAACWDWPRCT